MGEQTVNGKALVGKVPIQAYVSYRQPVDLHQVDSGMPDAQRHDFRKVILRIAVYRFCPDRAEGGFSGGNISEIRCRD